MLGIKTTFNEVEMNVKAGIEVKSVDALNYVLELEGEICSLDRTFTKNLRNTVYKLKERTAKEIYKEECKCGDSNRKHSKYVYDWAS